MHKGQKGIDTAEEGRRHIDGEGAAGTRNLDDHEYDTKGFSDVAEGDGEGVDEYGENESRHPAGKQKVEGVGALNAEEVEVSQGDKAALNEGDKKEEASRPK